MKNKVFSSLLILLFLLGAGLFLLPQKEVSKSEKRPLKTRSDIHAASLADGSFLKETEDVMKDQFYARSVLTSSYYRMKTPLNRLLNAAKGEPSYTYLSENVIELDEGYLINGMLKYDAENLSLAASKGYNINELDLKYPEIRTYVYFPTRAEEILENLIYGYDPNSFAFGLRYRESFLIQLNPQIRTSALKLNDILDHQDLFYRSDFHWTHKGAYEGYRDIVRMIGQDFSIGEPREIAEEICFDYEFSGNIGSQIGNAGATDHICDYRLKNSKPYALTADGNNTDLQDVKTEYAANGNDTQYSDYDVYFGNNYFERVFDFDQKDRPNILVFADSYTNVLQEWLASHFNKTVILDLRARPDDFSLDEYIERYNIDIFLITQPYTDLFFNGDMFIPLN